MGAKNYQRILYMRQYATLYVIEYMKLRKPMQVEKLATRRISKSRGRTSILHDNDRKRKLMMAIKIGILNPNQCSPGLQPRSPANRRRPACKDASNSVSNISDVEGIITVSIGLITASRRRSSGKYPRYP